MKYYRLESLEAFLKVEWAKCNAPNCVMGIDVTSYEDKFPCDKCNGSGHMHMKIRQILKNKTRDGI